ncbi:MAG: hypothetical protein ACLPTZ_26145 [Beijerinckiaceae bacterium]
MLEPGGQQLFVRGLKGALPEHPVMNGSFGVQVPFFSGTCPAGQQVPEYIRTGGRPGYWKVSVAGI